MKSPAVRLWWLLPIVAALAWWGLRPVPVKVELATVAERELVESVRDEGRTRVIHRYRLSAPVQGQLERIELRVGDQVEAGQVLARVLASTGALLDAASRRRVQAEAEAARAATAQAEARRNAAEATAQWAAADAERIRPLVQAGTLSKSEGERAETALRQAQAELRAARFAEQVARAQAAAAQALLEQQGQGDGDLRVELRAPVAGVVLARIRESAGPVGVGDVLLEIGDPAALEIEVDLLSDDAVRIEAGMPMRLRRWGGEGELAAQVRRVEPVGFTKVSALGVEEQRVLVIGDFVDAPERWQRLGDGYRVEAEFVLWQGQALSVPTSALFRRGDGWGVYVVEGGVARERAVNIGRRGGLDSEVREGLQAGEQVVAFPDDRVSEGARVEGLPSASG